MKVEIEQVENGYVIIPNLNWSHRKVAESFNCLTEILKKEFGEVKFIKKHPRRTSDEPRKNKRD